MIGDPLIISKKDYSISKEVIQQNTSDIILIGGGSGTAKSELSYCLQKELWEKKKSSFVISLDDYYLVHPSIRSINRKKLGLASVGISEIDWTSLRRIYKDYQDKKVIHFHRTHRFMDNIEFNTVESENIDFLIIEGLYANYLRKFYKDNFSVYLEGNPTQTLEFRKLRGKENEKDSFRGSVVEKEFKIVCQLRKYTDLILHFKEK